MIDFVAVVGALALQDKKSFTTLEVWWDGKSSENIIVNYRANNDPKNKLVSSQEDNKTFVDPFNIKKDEKNKKVIISHQQYSDLKITSYYGGRSSFEAQWPKSWKTRGLTGLYLID